MPLSAWWYLPFSQICLQLVLLLALLTSPKVPLGAAGPCDPSTERVRQTEEQWTTAPVLAPPGELPVLLQVKAINCIYKGDLFDISTQDIYNNIVENKSLNV